MACSKGQLIEDPGPLLPDRPGATAEIIPSFASDQAEIDRKSLRFALPDELGALPYDIAVESAAQPAIARDNENFDFLPLALLKQGMGGTIDALTEIAEHATHFMGVGPRSQNTILRTLELRGRDHFHGLRNFLRILEGGDFPP
jgi:hypothetical protein